MRAAIIGMGVTGRAQAQMFGEHAPVTYDINDGPYPGEAIAGCEFAVICVDTPQSDTGAADLRHFWDAVDDLPPKLPVLIRSTVPPRTTDKVRLERPRVHVAHAPEFMYERPGGKWTASADVPYLILGGDEGARAFFAPRLAKVFPGFIHECTALEAELCKYTVNLYWAARVTFVNEMARICEAFGADWEQVRRAWLEDPRMTGDYTAIRGFPPGFGGRCWPKDLAALISASRDAGYAAWLLSDIQSANARFRR